MAALHRSVQSIRTCSNSQGSHCWRYHSGYAGKVAASVLFSHDVTPDFQWNGSASYAHVKADSDLGKDNYNVVPGGAWQFLPNWVAHLDLTWSRAEENTGVLDELFDIDEKTLLLRIKHSIRSGRPFVTAGNKTGSSDYGEVRGEVF